MKKFGKYLVLLAALALVLTGCAKSNKLNAADNAAYKQYKAVKINTSTGITTTAAAKKFGKPSSTKNNEQYGLKVEIWKSIKKSNYSLYIVFMNDHALMKGISAKKINRAKTTISNDDYASIKKGMTKTQIFKKIGYPNQFFDSDFMGLTISGISYTSGIGSKYKSIDFEFEKGKLTKKTRTTKADSSKSESSSSSSDNAFSDIFNSL